MFLFQPYFILETIIFLFASIRITSYLQINQNIVELKIFSSPCTLLQLVDMVHETFIDRRRTRQINERLGQSRKCRASEMKRNIKASNNI